MSKKKPSGLWWKSLVLGVLLTVFAIIVGILTLIAEKPEGVIYTKFDTGKEVTFELKEAATLWLEETNRGLGSSPGTIRDAEKTIRLYGPDGEQIPFSDDRQGDDGSSKGTFKAPGPGAYKLVADSVGKAESYGRLRGKRPYSFYRTVCDASFFVALPLGLLLILLGIILGIVRGFGKAMEGGLEEGSV